MRRRAGLPVQGKNRGGEGAPSGRGDLGLPSGKDVEGRFPMLV